MTARWQVGHATLDWLLLKCWHPRLDFRGMKKRLLILADLGHLKAYRLLYRAPGLKPKFELIKTFSTQEANGRLRDKLTDSPETFRADAAKSQGVRASGERHNIELEFQRRAVKELAREISQIIRNEPESQECLFAASKEINPHIVEHLDPQARAKIVANWHDDLINLPNGELVGRVFDWERQAVGA
jgi:hypothetical protein